VFYLVMKSFPKSSQRKYFSSLWLGEAWLINPLNVLKNLALWPFYARITILAASVAQR
jgi:hypothetical protein